ncbi:MAG: hypothetical protein K6F53_07475 [Lachnospiraceae bacterium]|nr:hypothetical protein [Lachnospiraceae bacterium]
MTELERKFGKYAIPNLPLYIVICYGIGYLLQLAFPAAIEYLMLNPQKIIFNLQIWRLISWVLIPPGSFSIFTVITLYFYYSIGRSLEQVWGVWRFNVYTFSGLLFTVIGAFILYAITPGSVGWYMNIYPRYFSTYYISMSIFLAFATTFPDMQIFLFMILPVRVKYLAVIYGVVLGYEVISNVLDGSPAMAIVVASSLLNFGIFFIMNKRSGGFTPKQILRRHEFRKRSEAGVYENPLSGRDGRSAGSSAITRHKCAICGRTDQSNPELSFRFCSKCNGNYEYCEEHLFTHTHIK